MKREKIHRIRSFFAVLLACLIVAESVPPIPETIAADNVTAETGATGYTQETEDLEEIDLPEDETVFTGVLADEFDDEALVAMMAADLFVMPWEEEQAKEKEKHPSGAPAEKPGSAPEEPSAETPPAEAPAGQPGSTPEEPPAEIPPAEKPGSAPEEPAETPPAEQPGNAPEEPAAETPPAEAPAEQTGEAPAETSGEAPQEVPAEEPGIEPMEEVQEEPGIEPMAESQEEPGIEPMAESQEEPGIEPMAYQMEKPGIEPMVYQMEEPGIKPMVWTGGARGIELKTLAAEAPAAELPTDAPVGTPPGDAPTEPAAEQGGDTPTEPAAEQTGDVPSEPPAGTPAAEVPAGEPGEAPADAASEQPEEAPAEPLAENPDVTEHVKLKKQEFYINGQKVTDGSSFKVAPGASFSYEIEWIIDDHDGVGHARPEIKDNSFFEITLFQVKGLTIENQKDIPATISVNGRTIRIGTWSMTYDRVTGECVFRMNFSKYAGAFKEIGGFKKGSGKFNDSLEDGGTVTVGGNKGTIERIEVPEKPPVPEGPPAPPIGVDWNLPKPPTFNNTEWEFGKNMKFLNANITPPEMEYRAVYVEELQAAQKQLFLDNEENMKDDTLDGDTIKKTFPAPSANDYIIEDTLDVNQSFFVPKTDGKYVSAPFFFEIPIMAVGTGNFMNGGIGGWNNVSGNYYGFGDFGTNYIDASHFKRLDTIEEVRNNPMSWTVQKVTELDGQKREKLVVNIGPLGAESGEALLKSKINNGKFMKPIADAIQNAKDNIRMLEEDTNSPVGQLKKQTEELSAICVSAGIPEDKQTEIQNQVKKFQQWYEMYFSAEGSTVKELTNEAKADFAALTLKTVLEELEAHYEKLPQSQAYQNWKKAFGNLPQNQAYYADAGNREKYMKGWRDALMRYQLTEAFYDREPIYGFVMKYAVQIKNTSGRDYKNEIRITTGGVSHDAEVNLKMTFSHGIGGVFSGGDAVFQKADSGYGALGNAGTNGIAGAGFEVYCGKEKEDGGPGGENGDYSGWELERTPEHLGVFIDKAASAGGNAYVWSHNAENEPDEEIEKFGDVEVVQTDENGRLALNGLKDSEVHFLVEVKAPDGYYLDEKPIPFRTGEDKVLYEMIPNVARAVRLTKASSYDGDPVQGAEFELSKDGQPLTGFVKKSIRSESGAVTEFYWYDGKGEAKLQTFANGQLNIHGLPAGTYRLRETQPAPGFRPLEGKEKSYSFTLDEKIDKTKLSEENGFYYVLANPSGEPMLNDEKTKSVTITKTGKDGVPISGAAFKLQRFTGSEADWGNSPDQSKWEDVKVNESGIYFKTGAAAAAEGGFDVDERGQLTFTELPNGHYALLETRAPEDYEMARNRWYFDVDVSNDDEVSISMNPNGTPLEGNKIPNEFNNGTLKLSKLASGIGAELDGEFGFTISLKDRYGDEYVGWLNYVISSQKEGDSSDTVKSERIQLEDGQHGRFKTLLKHGQTLTLTGIPGASYTVEEATPEEYSLNIDRPSGTIGNGTTVSVTARNRYKSGSLRLTKEVGGLNGETDKAFTFHLQFADGESSLQLNGTFPCLRVDDTDNPPQAGTIEVKEGQADVQLKSGESVTIDGLPDGVFYIITEEEDDDYVTKASVDNHPLSEGGEGDSTGSKVVEGNTIFDFIDDNYRDNVLFTNTSVPDKGALMIAKYVDCLQVHKELPFQFKVTLKDNRGKPIEGRYHAVRGVRKSEEDANPENPKEDEEPEKPSQDMETEELELYFDENGEALFQLRHQEYLMFTDLPERSRYEVMEESVDGYDIVMGDAAKGTIQAGAADTPPILVTVANNHREGNLRISKLVDGRGADRSREFDFTLTLRDKNGALLDGLFPYVQSTVTKDAGGELLAAEPAPSERSQLEVKDGKVQFKLGHEQEIMISALPEGTQYQVEETADKDYTVSVTDGQGSIGSGQTSQARFINKFKVGQLTVKKIVAKGDVNKPFHFKVELSDNTINGLYNEVQFKDGVAEFDLTHDQVKIISELPAGIKYTVTESSDILYTVTSTGDTGTISETTNSNAVFTNTEKNLGALSVRKLVEGNAGDRTKEFSFTVTLKNADGTPLQGEFAYTRTKQEDDKEVPDKTGTLTSDEQGVIRMNLAHGQRLTLEHLPEGTRYEVAETEDPAYALTMEDKSGTIMKDVTAAVIARNRCKTGALRLTKLVGGLNADENREWKFQIQFRDRDGNNWTDTRTFPYMQADKPGGADLPQSGMLKVENGTAELSLKSGQSITIEELPDGTKYTVTETKESGDDYVTKASVSANQIQDGAEHPGGTVTVDGDTIGNVIEDNYRDNVLFTNTRIPDKGSLMVEKFVNCLQVNQQQSFHFKLTLKELNETGSPIANKSFKVKSGTRDSDGEITESLETTVQTNADGEIEFELKHQEYLLFTDLPKDSWYQVTETPVEGYDVSTGEKVSGVIDGVNDTEPILATVSNFHKEGNLKISKLVEGRGADLSQEFTFRLTLKDQNDVPLSGKYPYVKAEMASGSGEDALEEGAAPAESLQMEVVNGTAEFRLRHGQELTLSALPEGTKYTVEELETGESGKYDVESENASGSIGGSHLSQARFTNHFKVGMLMVTKSVNRGDTDKFFSFTVTLSDRTINGTYHDMDFKDGVAKIKLRHEETKIASELPVGVTYWVKEESDEDYRVEYEEGAGMTVLEDQVTGKLPEGHAMVQVINTEKEYGSLSVQKLVTGDGAERTRQFPFEIVLQEASGQPLAGSFPYKVTEQQTDEDGNTTEKTVEEGTRALGDTGQFTQKLAHGQKLKLTKLPAGTKYTVTETEDLAYEQTMTNATGEIQNKREAAVTANNRYRTGRLSLKKNVIGSGKDMETPFAFTLQFEDASHNPLAGTYPLTGAADEGVTPPENGSITLKNGKAEVELKAGQQMTIAGLPAGTTYTVTEKENEEYTTTISARTQGADSESAGEIKTEEGTEISGLLADQAHVEVVCTNERIPKTGSLTLSKFVQGGQADEGAAFTFHIRLSEETSDDESEGGKKTKPLGGTFETELFADGKTTSGTLAFDEEGRADVTLKHGERLLMKGIPDKTHYRIEEAEAPGYESSIGGQPAEGIIQEEAQGEEPISVSVTNFHKEGELLIRKEVTGRGGDTQREFTFTVRLEDAGGAPLGGSYRCTKSSGTEDGGEPESSVLTLDEQGQGKLTLKHGEQIRITGLPDGAVYHVTEEKAEGYETLVTGVDSESADETAADGENADKTVADGESADKTGADSESADETAADGAISDETGADRTAADGTISDQRTAEAAFVNRFRNGELRVSKTVAKGDKKKPFHFTVRLHDVSVNGIYGDMEFKDSVAEFDLKDGEEKAAAGLPAGVEYTVEEDQYKDYSVSKTGDQGSIPDQGSAEAAFTNTKQKINPPTDPPVIDPPKNPPTDPPLIELPPKDPPKDPPMIQPPKNPPKDPPVIQPPKNPPKDPPKNPPANPPKDTPKNPPANPPRDTPTNPPGETRPPSRSNPPKDTPTSRVRTGDRPGLLVPISLMGASLCGIAAVMRRRRRNKE